MSWRKCCVCGAVDVLFGKKRVARPMPDYDPMLTETSRSLFQRNQTTSQSSTNPQPKHSRLSTVLLKSHITHTTIAKAQKQSHFDSDMSSTVLANRDINTERMGEKGAAQADVKADVKSMEYHRQVLQSKLDESKYVVLLDAPSLCF